MLKKLRISLYVFLTLFITSATTMAFADDDDCDERDGYERVEVSGTGIHDFNTVILHREKKKPNWRKTITTETIDLSGDLEGRVLYQPTGIEDSLKGTLVNTGRQVFSGTILGSRPVMIYDDEYRFEVNFFTGEVRGKVFLSERIAGPRITCELEIRESGLPPVDNRTSSTYEGVCWIRKKG